jgi:hypothetical protein
VGVMSLPTVIVFGLAAGLAVTLFANVVLLPRVLQEQRQKLGSGWKMPVTGWGVEMLAKRTTLIYRYGMPVVFSKVFAAVGYYATSEVHGAN